MTGTTISTYLTSSLSLASANQDPVVITSSGAVVTTSTIAVYGPSGIAWSISNSGTISGTTGIRLMGDGVLDNSASGTIAGSGAAGAVQIEGAATVANLGRIAATYAGSLASGAPGVGLGSGSLTNGAPGGSTATISGYFGVLLRGSGSVVNYGTLLGVDTPFYAHSAGYGSMPAAASSTATSAARAPSSRASMACTSPARRARCSNFATIGGVNSVVLTAGGTWQTAAAPTPPP